MEKLISKFENYLLGKKKFSNNTIASYVRDVEKFIKYNEKKHGEKFVNRLTEEYVDAYINYLKQKEYSISTLSRNLSSINIFFEFLFKEGYVDKKIYSDIKFNKKNERELIIFTKEEINNILNIICDSFITYRDKAIFELVYAIGIKPTECINLELKDVNLEIGFLKYEVKNNYRTIPLNNEAVYAIKDYIEARDVIAKKSDCSTKLFISSDGRSITRQGFWKIFKKRQLELSLEKELNTTTFRNSLAVHLLEDGISPDIVKEVLGLKNLNSLKNYLRTAEHNESSKKVMLNHPRKILK